MNIVQTARSGLIAGTAGIAALNVVAYADMLARARPASTMPATLVRNAAQRAGVEALTGDDESSAHRRDALGALLGYANGLSVAAVYGCVRPVLRDVIPLPVAVVAVSAAAMALTDLPAARLKATDPAAWGLADWVADAIPHLAFGAVVAFVFEKITFDTKK